MKQLIFNHLLRFGLLGGMLLAFCIPALLVAQAPSQHNTPLRIGLGLAGYLYRGDLTDDPTRFHRIYPGVNFSLQSAGRSSLQLQLNTGFGKFSEQYDGAMPAMPEGVVPISFVETSFFYGDLRLKFRMLRRRRIQPFVSAGAGFLIFSPKDKNGKFLSDAILTRPEGEEYNTSIPQIPGSVGFQARITPLVWAGLEYTYRFTPTDYLDNIGQLGQRPGNDRLHSLQFTLYFQISGKEEAQWEQLPPPLPDPRIAGLEYPGADTLVRNWLPESQPQDTLLTVQQEVAAAAGKEALDGVTGGTLSPNLRPELGKIAVILAPPMLLPDLSALEESKALSYWDSLALAALQRGEVFYYRVQGGETYDYLSERFYVSSELLSEINEVSDSAFSTSIQLVIPDIRQWIPNFETAPQISETADLALQSRGRNADAAAAEVEIQQDAKWAEKEETAIRQSRYIYYQIKESDTLYDIALKYHTRMSTIRKLNSLRDDTLYPGTFLRLPDLQ